MTLTLTSMLDLESVKMNQRARWDYFVQTFLSGNTYRHAHSVTSDLLLYPDHYCGWSLIKPMTMRSPLKDRRVKG